MEAMDEHERFINGNLSHDFEREIINEEVAKVVALATFLGEEDIWQ